MGIGFLTDSEHTQRFREFRTRFVQRGAAGVTDLEAAEWHEQIAGVTDGERYEQAVVATIAELPEDERSSFAAAVAELVRRDRVESSWDGSSTDPVELARAMRALHDAGPSVSELVAGTSGPGASPGNEAALSPARQVLAGIAVLAGEPLFTAG